MSATVSAVSYPAAGCSECVGALRDLQIVLRLVGSEGSAAFEARAVEWLGVAGASLIQRDQVVAIRAREQFKHEVEHHERRLARPAGEHEECA